MTLPSDVLCGGAVLSNLYFRSKRKDSTITVNYPSYLKLMPDCGLATPEIKPMISQVFSVEMTFLSARPRGGYQQLLQRAPRIWTALPPGGSP
jgi:hypothetical protein